MSSRSGAEIVALNQEQVDGGPHAGKSSGREFTSRVFLPVLALASVICIWWILYLIYPRLLPSPLNTFREALRLISDGSFFFHMLQSLRRVFVGAAVAMIFSVAVGIYMGTMLTANAFFNRSLLLA
jgi:ABC-type nitrate/sulfonate/bicarbonate transport system permease component